MKTIVLLRYSAFLRAKSNANESITAGVSCWNRTTISKALKKNKSCFGNLRIPGLSVPPISARGRLLADCNIVAFFEYFYMSGNGYNACTELDVAEHFST